MPSNYLSYNWVYLGYTIYALALLIFLIACRKEPGIINKSSVTTLIKKYPYDNVNYIMRECITCKFKKY